MASDDDNVCDLAEATCAADKAFHEIVERIGIGYAVRAFAIVLGAQAAYQPNPKGAVSDAQRLVQEAMERYYRERAQEEKENEAAPTAEGAGENIVPIGSAKRQGAVSRLDGRAGRDEPE